MDSSKLPQSVLIIGSGVFGLSTAYSLAKNPLFKDVKITVIDRLEFPAPDGASVRNPFPQALRVYLSSEQHLLE